MERSVTSRLSNLKSLLATLTASVQADNEIAAILEEYQVQIYSLQEDRKRLLATVRDQDQRIRSLETRYSELLYKLSELKK